MFDGNNFDCDIKNILNKKNLSEKKNRKNRNSLTIEVIYCFDFVSGMRPLLYSEKAAKTQSKGWIRAGHHIR